MIKTSDAFNNCTVVKLNKKLETSGIWTMMNMIQDKDRSWKNNNQDINCQSSEEFKSFIKGDLFYPPEITKLL